MLEFAIALEHAQKQLGLKGSLKEIKPFQIFKVGQTRKVQQRRIGSTVPQT